jgi:hypothetical protein
MGLNVRRWRSVALGAWRVRSVAERRPAGAERSGRGGGTRGRGAVVRRRRCHRGRCPLARRLGGGGFVSATGLPSLWCEVRRWGAGRGPRGAHATSRTSRRAPRGPFRSACARDRTLLARRRRPRTARTLPETTVRRRGEPSRPSRRCAPPSRSVSRDGWQWRVAVCEKSLNVLAFRQVRNLQRPHSRKARRH